VDRVFASKGTLTIRHETVSSGDIALYSTKWTLSLMGPDGSPVKMNGKGGVVLRRQPDGQWLIAIENPWTDI
jgi:ketosteroid isomerase-like protein